ncbi:hypothetical protein VTG60DRAFT_463 [Thermothelomyces hinnuleus]
MISVWGGMATAVALCLAFAALQASSSSFSTPIQRRRSETRLSLGRDANTRCHETWLDPVRGTQPLSGLLARPLNVVGKRDCLANGSNYCFGNDIDFCPDCGNCCVDGKICCGHGKVCCGSGCCLSDQICSQGKCLSVEPTTVTSTVLQTATRVATQRATIVIAELETSTVVSSTEVTISTAATQTIVVWVTATAVEKRAAADAAKLGLGKGEHLSPAPSHSGVRILRRSPILEDDFAPIPPIQARQGTAATVTEYVTKAVDVTSISSVLVTVHTTSTYVTTIYQTNTRVLKAEATTTVTSTVTLVSHPPEVITFTKTASLIPPPPTASQDDSPTASSSAESRTLSTPAIAGIAAGSSVLALFLVGFVVLSIRRRFRWRTAHPPADSVKFGYDRGNNVIDYRRRSGEDDTMPPKSRRNRSSTTTTAPRSDTITPRHQQPTLPRILPHFTTTAAHHDTEYKLPGSLLSASIAYKGEESRGAGGNGYNTGAGQPCNQRPGNDGGGGRHERSASGYTTLVGTPSSTSPAFATVQPQHQQHQQTQQTQRRAFLKIPPESPGRTHWADTPAAEGGRRRSMSEAVVTGGAHGDGLSTGPNDGAWERTYIPPPATVSPGAGSSTMSWS